MVPCAAARRKSPGATGAVRLAKSGRIAPVCADPPRTAFLPDSGAPMRSTRLAALLALLLAALPLRAQGVPTPLAHFGFQPGDHRRLADWTELLDYYEALARASPRVKLDTLGTTTLGRPFLMLTVNSPE